MTEEQLLKEVKTLFNKGLSQMKIAEKLGVSRSPVRRVISKLGLKKCRPQDDKDVIKKVVTLYEGDNRIESISKSLKIPIRATKEILTKNCDTYSIFTYELNHDYFEEIDTSEKSYWLGFLMADGWVTSDTKERENNRIGLKLKEADREHVEKFKEAIGSSHPIKRIKTELNGKVFYGAQLRVNSHKMKSDLIDKGCVPNKTLIAKFPKEKKVPRKFIYDFIRGYMDGDGYVSIFDRDGKIVKKDCSYGVVGSYDMLQGIGEYLKIKISHKKTHHPNIYIGQQGGAFIVIEELSKIYYKKDVLCLQRKRDKYEQIVKYWNV